jgi:Tol biopolymer transport system component
MRRTLLITVLTGLVAAAAAAPASATFPGLNGPIAYRPFDPATGLGQPLLRARADGTHVHQVSDRPGFFSDWRADGRRLAFDYFEPDGDEQIATANPNGGDVRAITSGAGIHEVPSWSPDGTRIAFDFSPTSDPNTPDFRTALWTMRADGSGQRPLPVFPSGFDVEPKYSPNGRWIAFDRLLITPTGDQQQAVFIVSANGGIAWQLTPWQLNAEHPTWSPDSNTILFNTPEGTIAAIRPDGSNRHTILAATPALGGHKPWSSPDARKILFMCATPSSGDHNEDICVMNANGTHITHLTHTPATLENWPSWAPAP